MKTSKPFATISYNTEDFLVRKLDELITKRVIEFWAWVHHLKEEDEAKDHKHIYFVPNGQVNTDQISDYLIEPDPTSPLGLPLRCIRFRSSKFADWYLYNLHDPDYLASKGQSRKFRYTFEDFKSSDKDYLQEEIHTIDYSALNRSKNLKQAVFDGIPFENLVINGQIPIQQVKQYEYAYALMGSVTYRNNRTTHTPIEEDPRLIEIKDDSEEVPTDD